MTAESFDVAGFPDLLPLRDARGGVVGLFSDCGSWLGVTLGARGELELWDLAGQELRRWGLGLRPASVTSWADRLELELEAGQQARLGFAGLELLVLEGRSGRPPELRAPWPTRVVAGGEPWRLLLGPAAGHTPDPARTLFEDNRARWDTRFARARATQSDPGDARDSRLLARAVTTLLWNTRGPNASLRHSGVVPSPFTYRGYWAWDSWKHAHALAGIAPELAAEQLRAQFQRQRDDGMVPDAVYPDSSRDHWNCTKPPLAAWALERLHASTGDAELVAELYGKCAAQMEWFERDRRLEGEVLLRAGGVDHQTATWDTGWDDCARFEGVPLVEHGAWKLFDLWQPDYNAYCWNEYRALARLAPRIGLDPRPWEERASALATALRSKLWDERRGAFCDVRASTGESTGLLSAAAWLPVWAGLADARQSARVRALLQQPEHFATELPFPVLAASEPAFDPDGYWNGAVWVDHAVLALAALGDEGRALRERFLERLAGEDSLFECYSPVDGRPARGARPATAQFSWTAAALVGLLSGGPRSVAR